MSYIKRVDYIKGNPLKNPLTREELLNKFRDCASWAKKPLSQGKVDEVIRFIDNLEESDDVTMLIPLAFGSS